MNNTEHFHRVGSRLNRLMTWPLLCGLLGMALVRPALAADNLFQNDGIITYPGTEVNPPVIDATNFVNTGTINISFTFLPAKLLQFYETSDTLNYTNTGLIMGNTGFQFDDQSSVSGTRRLSANFYNQGTISAGSIDNLIDPYDGLLGLFGYFPQCFINATNIVSPGVVDVGVEGLIQFTGENVDLSAGTLYVEGAAANSFGVSCDF
mgnify:FL=1